MLVPNPDVTRPVSCAERVSEWTFSTLYLEDQQCCCASVIPHTTMGAGELGPLPNRKIIDSRQSRFYVKAPKL